MISHFLFLGYVQARENCFLVVSDTSGFLAFLFGKYRICWNEDESWSKFCHIYSLIEFKQVLLPPWTTWGCRSLFLHFAYHLFPGKMRSCVHSIVQLDQEAKEIGLYLSGLLLNSESEWVYLLQNLEGARLNWSLTQKHAGQWVPFGHFQGPLC